MNGDEEPAYSLPFAKYLRLLVTFACSGAVSAYVYKLYAYVLV